MVQAVLFQHQKIVQRLKDTASVHETTSIHIVRTYTYLGSYMGNHVKLTSQFRQAGTV